jgi:hypothetical protein
VVVDNLNLVRVARVPAKADPPLPVDADAVLTRSITLQLFESIGWRDS